MTISMITIVTDKGFNDNNGDDVSGNNDDVDGNGAMDDDIDDDNCDGAMDGDHDDNKYDGTMEKLRQWQQQEC